MFFFITAPRNKLKFDASPSKLKYSDRSPSQDTDETPLHFETLQNAAPLPPFYDNRMVAKLLTDISHVLYELAEYVYPN